MGWPPDLRDSSVETSPLARQCFFPWLPSQPQTRTAVSRPAGSTTDPACRTAAPPYPPGYCHHDYSAFPGWQIDGLPPRLQHVSPFRKFVTNRPQNPAPHLHRLVVPRQNQTAPFHSKTGIEPDQVHRLQPSGYSPSSVEAPAPVSVQVSVQLRP